MKLMCFSRRWLPRFLFLVAFISVSQVARSAAPGPSLAGSFNSVPAGSAVNLTAEGEADWVHWGLFTETSLDRKAGVVPQISDFTLFGFAQWVRVRVSVC
jgi:hypothetical protein